MAIRRKKRLGRLKERNQERAEALRAYHAINGDELDNDESLYYLIQVKGFAGWQSLDEDGSHDKKLTIGKAVILHHRTGKRVRVVLRIGGSPIVWDSDNIDE